jgi:GTP-binding protein
MLDEIKFEKSVYLLNDLPKVEFPQIIMCGRSNVGKSSLINSIFNRKSLAKTSSTPGKTRSINFYLVDDKFYLVDLPGYGYSKTSLQERKKWAKLISEYFSTASKIKHALHIIDSRHEPTELDIKLNELLKFANISYTFVLNKADKLKQSELKSIVIQTVKIFNEAVQGDNLFFYSSTTSRWKRELKNRLTDLFYVK